MSVRERGLIFKIVTAVSTAVIVLLILTWAYDTGRLVGITESEYERHSDAYARHAQEDIQERCLLSEPVAQAECIREVVEATREDERAERDLIAQSEMALWAFWMLIVTGVTAAVTGIGVYYVRSTLMQAGETNRAAVAAAEAANEANRIMRAESRPWISIDQNVMCDFIYEEGSDRCNIWWQYTLTNKGKMPAHNISVSWGIYRYDWGFIGAGKQGVADVVNMAKRTRLYDISVLFPSESAPQTTYGGNRIWGENDGTIFLCFCVAYSLDALDQKRAVTAQAFTLRNENGQLGPLAFKMLRINGNGYTRIE